MKFVLITLAILAVVAADVSHLPSNEYLPPFARASAPSVEYLPPVQSFAAAPEPSFAPAPDSEPAHDLADDGYRYKTHRRVVYRRHRRDVSHLPSNEYLPPVQAASARSNEYTAPEPSYAPAYVSSHAVAPVPSYAPAPAYSPAPVPLFASASAPEPAPEPAHVLADDGYRYKTHRRVVYRRHRRDVSHLPSNEYLPPVEAASARSNEYTAPEPSFAPAPALSFAPAPAPEPAHVLADDGYRYKTNRRVVYRRHRRDVSHLPSSEYLPPVQAASAPSNEYLAPELSFAPAPEPAHDLADDGYRYKTHRRVVYRRH